MMLMMSSANGGFERQKVRLVLDDEFPGFYTEAGLAGLITHLHVEELWPIH